MCIGRRSVGISLALCKKQDRLLSSTPCAKDSVQIAAVAEANGCKDENNVQNPGQCHCADSDYTQKCMDAKDCKIGQANGAWVKRACMADVGPDTTNGP
jgi:hypothetical protein